MKNSSISPLYIFIFFCNSLRKGKNAQPFCINKEQSLVNRLNTPDHACKEISLQALLLWGELRNALTGNVPLVACYYLESGKGNSPRNTVSLLAEEVAICCFGSEKKIIL